MCFSLHLDHLTCLSTFLRLEPSEWRLSAAFKLICLLSVFRHQGWGLRLFFLVSLKRGSQRRQEAFSNMLVQVCMWAGVCKGHSECTSGLSCATCCQDPIERDLKKGSERCHSFLCPRGGNHFSARILAGPPQRPGSFKHRL